MAVDRKRCFWFGTEERAGFFPTPNQGGDSSPAAWGTEGTLLNGGGYGFYSFGSHKRFTYEWPQSSSPETAQMMKSYRDGTYGRGLLYFLEPGIYRTNILPAHWADPSMSINNEAPSLVYGLDPIAVPTSGGATLGLPVTSAQYDLSTTPAQSNPTPDSSVFLPVPTGHTLILGAFYSATGTGGVYVTPVNSNGTLGTSVKLTERPNTDTDVVTDQFSGDITGVRLWVGRTDATSSSVTIAAMSGRLIETSDVPVYSAWSVTDTNQFIHPTPVATTGFSVTSSTMAIASGGIELTTTVATSAANQSRLNYIAPAFRRTVTPGATVGFSADVLSPASRQGSVSILFYDAGGVYISGSILTSAPLSATPSFQRISVQGTVPALAVTAGFYLANGGVMSIGEKLVFRHMRFGTPGTYFTGSTAGDDLNRYAWTDTVEASTSTHETRTISGPVAKFNNFIRGPWIGGQGHSGCRFSGTPSYVTNSPIEGGRVGFAASFIEVGSWVYG